MPVVTMTDMSSQEEANKVKELVVAALVEEGYLIAEKGREFLSQYAVVMRAKSWFGKLIDRLHGAPPDNAMAYQVVRLVKLGFESSDDGSGGGDGA